MKHKWIFTFNGETKPLLDWCNQVGRDYSAACKMARRGATIEHILKPRHGAARGGRQTRAYACWVSMRHRCADKNDRWYGSKGITVCHRWDDFAAFLADMGDPPSKSHQIDRIDATRGYEPENCRWATPSANALNRRTTRWIEFKGERRSLSQWSDHLGISIRTLKGRIDTMGWSLERAFTTWPRRTGR